MREKDFRTVDLTYSARNVGMYQYKIQAVHQLLPADTDLRQNFSWVLAQMERNSQCLLNVMWTDEFHFSQSGDVNVQNSPI